MLKLLTIVLALIHCLMTPAMGATQIYRCNVNGAVIIQQTQCPSNESQKRPTVDDLNAARKKAPASENVKTNPERPLNSATLPALSNSPYRCDGRKYCSQMSSCSEAKYFLSNCPGVKMDGDGDGIPCEEQWCQ